jgi:tRNA pseudouridine55 synthase
MIDGLVVVDKPAGMTSHDVVARCRRIFGQKRVGHAGTLDPDATGVLLVGLGRATRLMQYMSAAGKSYVVDIVVGVATDTLDSSGRVTATWDQGAVTIEQARVAAAQLTGTIRQAPPMVSAVKVGGRRLHELARAGVEVERPARQVTVARFDVVRRCPSGPGEGHGVAIFHAEIDCSSGTYIRVLAADLGANLGGGAHVRNLRRTAVGPWTVADSTPLDAVDRSAVIRPVDAVPWLEPLVVDEETCAAVRHGKVLDRRLLPSTGDGPWRVIGPLGDLLAVYVPHGSGSARPAVVLDAAN